MADVKLAEVMQNLKTGENPELAKLIKEQSGKLKDTDIAKFIAEKLRKTDEPSVLNDVVVPTIKESTALAGDLLQKPQQGYQMMANYATDNDINSKSYGPAIKTILSKLPQPLQMDEQAQQALTMGADTFLDPLEGLGKVGAGVGSIMKTEKMPITLGHIEQRLNNVNSASRPMNAGKSAATVLNEAPNSFFGKTAVKDSTMPQQNFGKVTVVSNQREIDAAEKMKETGRKLALKEAERQAAKYGDKVNQSVMKLPQQ